jgi:hypothetical protein
LVEFGYGSALRFFKSSLDAQDGLLPNLRETGAAFGVIACAAGPRGGSRPARMQPAGSISGEVALDATIWTPEGF